MDFFPEKWMTLYNQGWAISDEHLITKKVII